MALTKKELVLLVAKETGITQVEVKRVMNGIQPTGTPPAGCPAQPDGFASTHPDASLGGRA